MSDYRPPDEQIEQWERIAAAKLRVLAVLAEAIASGEPASSGWLREACGLSADEWHNEGELIAALIYFGAEKGFLDWHAETMVK